MSSLSNNENSYKTFKRNLSSNPINLFNKHNKNKLLLLSQDNSQDLSFNYQKSPTNRVSHRKTIFNNYVSKSSINLFNSSRELNTAPFSIIVLSSPRILAILILSKLIYNS